MRYTTPTITDFGSIAAHTFTRCNPSGAINWNDNPHGIPPKNEDPTYAPDNYLECSTAPTGLS